MLHPGYFNPHPHGLREKAFDLPEKYVGNLSPDFPRTAEPPEKFEASHVVSSTSTQKMAGST